jgi:hypothetical protein
MMGIRISKASIKEFVSLIVIVISGGVLITTCVCNSNLDSS